MTTTPQKNDPFERLSYHLIESAEFAEAEIEGKITDHVLSGIWKERPKRLVQIMAQLMREAAEELKTLDK